MNVWARTGRLQRRVVGASTGLLVALTGCTTQKPAETALSCSGTAPAGTVRMRTVLPAAAARGLRERPQSVTALPGGPSLVLPAAAAGGAPTVYRVGPDGDLTAGRVQGTDVTQRWSVPLGEEFHPRSALVTVEAPSGAGGPLVVAAHHQSGDSHSAFRLVSDAGEVLLRCTWRPYDRNEHVELSAGGTALVATRTTTKPHLSGASSVADRFVEVFSTETGGRVAQARTTDYAQDGVRAYGRLGAEVFAHDLGSGRSVWRTDTGIRMGDPRKGGSDPVFLVRDRVLVYAPADRTVVVLDAATGKEAWRGGLPGPVQSVQVLGGNRMLIHYRGGFAFAGPDGVERVQSIPQPGDGAHQRLEHLVRTGDGVMAAVVDQHDRSAPALTVFGDTGGPAARPLRIPLTASHVQAVLTDTVAYVLPWVPDGEQATLHAYDLTAGGRLLWRLPVPDRLTITDSPGPDPGLHPFDGGLYGLDRSTGWILHPAS